MPHRDEQERLRTILDRVDVASDEILAAAKSGDVVRLKAALTYWFGILYDEGLHRAVALERHNETLEEVIARLKEMNARLRDPGRPPR